MEAEGGVGQVLTVGQPLLCARTVQEVYGDTPTAGTKEGTWKSNGCRETSREIEIGGDTVRGSEGLWEVISKEGRRE